MLITRTPFRVSLFGGGTDIPSFFQKEEGKVLSFSINKYAYVTVRKLPPFFDHKIRIAYSKLEKCNTIDEIKHPLVRIALKDFEMSNLEIHYDADVPSKSGLGTSSAFAVGLANNLFSINGDSKSNYDLAKKAIYWERYCLKEKGGYQDQIASSFGGVNNINFYKDLSFNVKKIKLKKSELEELNSRMILCYIPTSRFSSDYSTENYMNEKETFQILLFLKELVDESQKYIYPLDIDNIANLLNESWKYKRKLKNVTLNIIDSVYEKAMKSGAIGGKLLGAGGGGFMFFITKENSRKSLIDELKPFIAFPICIENDGTKILYKNI